MYGEKRYHGTFLLQDCFSKRRTSFKSQDEPGPDPDSDRNRPKASQRTKAVKATDGIIKPGVKQSKLDTRNQQFRNKAIKHTYPEHMAPQPRLPLYPDLSWEPKRSIRIHNKGCCFFGPTSYDKFTPLFPSNVEWLHKGEEAPPWAAMTQGSTLKVSQPARHLARYVLISTQHSILNLYLYLSISYSSLIAARIQELSKVFQSWEDLGLLVRTK